MKKLFYMTVALSFMFLSGMVDAATQEKGQTAESSLSGRA